jgi:hypothetical protein
VVLPPDSLRDFFRAASDAADAEEIKRELAEASRERRPLYLDPDQFERIARWKLRGQYGRTERHFSRITDSALALVSGAAFAVEDPDFGEQTRLRLGLLQALPGVGIGVASAILSLALPERYCVIDFRGWRVAYGVDRRNFSANDYLRYLADVRLLADHLGWSVQDTDLAMWEFDRAVESI